MDIKQKLVHVHIGNARLRKLGAVEEVVLETLPGQSSLSDTFKCNNEIPL